MQPIRVMLVDDSPVYLGVMQAAIKYENDMELVGCYNDGVKALKDVMRIQPNVIVCDLHMPQISGIEFVESILKTYKVPVVIVSRDEKKAAAALAAGAVHFIPKDSILPINHIQFSTKVTESVRAVAQTRESTKANIQTPPKQVKKETPLFGQQTNGVIAIGASTGGTDATLAVVKNLPADFPALLITQHMPVGFTTLYAERLQRECRMQVYEAVDGMRLKQGQAIVAKGEQHLSLMRDQNGFFVRSRAGEKVCGHVPSVDVLFQSVANQAKENAIGVLLTGMGADGAAGLLAMRKAGAFTFGQDERTSIVYGMPKVAYDIGAVKKQLALSDIAEELIIEAKQHLK